MRVCCAGGASDYLWVDRGIDGRADFFVPCPACQTAIQDLRPADGWRAASFCPDCNARLEIDGAIDGLLGERPKIWPPELGGSPAPPSAEGGTPPDGWGFSVASDRIP